MNDLLSLIKKDLTNLIEKLFNDDVIRNNISNKLTIDYNSKSKQGDLSSNLLFILKGQILNKSFNINEYVENYLWFNQLSGEHFFESLKSGAFEKTQLNWRASYSEASREVPARKRYRYIYDDFDEVFRFPLRTDAALTSWNDLKDQIYTYCRSGARSEKARKILLKIGYRYVKNLGGIETWEKAGGQVESGDS